ncbi:MAG: TRAP transporter substrate-binding protein DctP [Deltaproteobacteria bacterium]|nr:TRAP transporter substrate-binding protein DctP [Deltaproteobacteria bacterium]
MPYVRTTVLIAVILLALCPAAGAGETAVETGPAFVWKMATVVPKGIGWAQHVQSILTPAMVEATDGDLEIKVYWGGVMGDDEDVIRKMEQGILDGSGFTAQGTAQVCPEMQVLSLPFLFNDYGEVDYVRERTAPLFAEYLEKKGYHLLAWGDQDFDQVYSTDKNMSELAQWQGARCALWSGPLEEALITALGAEPVPLDVPELSRAARRGVLNVAIGPAVWVVGAQLHNVARYILPIRIRYSPSIIVVKQEAWEALPEKYRTRITANKRRNLAVFYSEVRKDNEKYLRAMFTYGVKKVQMKPGELAKMKKRTRPLWDELAGVLYSRDLLVHIQDLLNEYRAGRKAGN